MNAFKIIILTLILSISMGKLLAQHKNGGGNQPDYDKLKTELSLTDDQLIQLKQVDASFKDRMQALRSSGASEDEKKQQRKILMEERKQELSAFLTEEQMQKLHDLQKDKNRDQPRR